jgi:hypothetical protein
MMGTSKAITMPSVLILMVCVCTIGFMLSGCSSDRTVNPAVGAGQDPSPNPTADIPERGLDSKGEVDNDRAFGDDNAIFGQTEESAQFDVDPELGGTFDAGRVAVSIPPNALNEPITLQIAEKNSNGMAVIGELLPHGQVFNRPVTLSFDLTGTPAETWDDPIIFWYDEENKAWVGIGGTLNVDTRVLHVRLEHFSHYGVGRAGWYRKPPPATVQEPGDENPEVGAP